MINIIHNIKPIHFVLLYIYTRTFIIGVAVLTVQPVVSDPHIRARFSVAKLDAESIFMNDRNDQSWLKIDREICINLPSFLRPFNGLPFV